MNAAFLKVQTHVWAMWRYHWQAMIMAWIICLMGWFFVYTMPDKYEVWAKVHVDTQSVLKPLLRGLTVETDVLDTVSMMSQAMLSRNSIAKVARDTNLQHRAKDEKEFESLIKELQKKIKIRRVGHYEENIFLITFFDSDPVMAKKVVDALLDGFVENTLGLGRVDAKSAQDFLDDQISDYEARLETAEAALKEFKRKNVGLMPGKDIDYFQRLQAALLDLDQATLEWRETRDKARSLRRQLSGEEPTFGFSGGNKSNTVTQALVVRINKLEAKLDQLRTTYTDSHPDVAAVIKSINELNAQKENEIKNMTSMGIVSGPEENPVYQQLKIALGSAEAEAASLKVRRNEYQARVNKLKKSVDTVPKIEADLKKLNRDYSVIKAQYEIMLGRRESARLSEQAEKNSEDVQFRIIEKPREPLYPTGPHRIIFSTIVLLAGIAAGLALAFFFSQIKPVYITGRELVKDTGFPLLGSVSVVRTELDQINNKQSIRRFSLTGVLLFFIYITVVVEYKFDLILKITSTATSAT